jgi:hypothetical protein
MTKCIVVSLRFLLVIMLVLGISSIRMTEERG